MLKIKDNVDLNDLKIFGFIEFSDFYYKPKKTEKSVVIVKIDTKTKIININNIGDMFNTKEDTLYNLIINNLVEKVE